MYFNATVWNAQIQWRVWQIITWIQYYYIPRIKMNLGNTSYDIHKWDYATRAAAKDRRDGGVLMWRHTGNQTANKTRQKIVLNLPPLFPIFLQKVSLLFWFEYQCLSFFKYFVIAVFFSSRPWRLDQRFSRRGMIQRLVVWKNKPSWVQISCPKRPVSYEEQSHSSMRNSLEGLT